jgi:hypothetical protein
MLDVAASYGYGPKDFRVSADVGTDSQVKKEGGQTIVYRMSRKFLMSLAHKLDIRKEEVRLRRRSAHCADELASPAPARRRNPAQVLACAGRYSPT